MRQSGRRSGRRAIGLALVVGAIAVGAGPVSAQAQERCYGIARAGQNQGIGDRQAPGTSRVDYQGDAWTLVPAGTCLTTRLPPQPDGTPRRGAMDPLDRDQP